MLCLNCVIRASASIAAPSSLRDVIFFLNWLAMLCNNVGGWCICNTYRSRPNFTSEMLRYKSQERSVAIFLHTITDAGRTGDNNMLCSRPSGIQLLNAKIIVVIVQIIDVNKQMLEKNLDNEISPSLPYILSFLKLTPRYLLCHLPEGQYKLHALDLLQ